MRRPLQHRGSTRPGGTQSKVTEMLLIVSTVFIALNLPSYIIRLWIFVNEVRVTPRRTRHPFSKFGPRWQTASSPPFGPAAGLAEWQAL